MMRWITEYLPSLYAGISALGVSALMDIRAGKPKLYMVTGSLICGIVAVALAALLNYLGLPNNAGAFVGAVIGFVGADKLRDVALQLFLRKTGADNGNQ